MDDRINQKAHSLTLRSPSQEGDVWFFEPGQAIRTLAELIPVYHSTVGNNVRLQAHGVPESAFVSMS